MNENIKAILFDLDGVVLSTDHYHYLAWKKLADELGISFTEADSERTRGVSRMESLEIVLEKVSPQHSGYASMIISTVACFALQIASSKRIVAKASPSLRC